MPEFSSILFLPGAHVDVTGRLDGPPIAGVSNPGKVVSRPGGAGLNMASVTAALGVETALAGPVGTDSNGQLLRHTVAERGIGDALIPSPNVATGTYTAIVAPDGELVVGLADLAAYEAVDGNWLLTHCAAAMEAANLWCVSTNLTGQALEEVAARAGGRKLAAATISPAKAARLAGILGSLDLIFTNLAEARALAGSENGAPLELAQRLAGAGVAAGTLSRGPEPLIVWKTGEFWQITPPAVHAVTDVNGAGDALAAAMLAGIAKGMPFDLCARIAVAAAQWTLSASEPFVAELNWRDLEKRAQSVEPPVRLG